MKSICKAILFSVLIMALASCNASTPEPTATPIPTATSLPTSTNTPEPTVTPTVPPTIPPTEIPTNTPIPPTETPSTSVLPMPSGEPATEWEGIPVMPNAISGEGDKKGYFFTINATLDEVHVFYEEELAKLGWDLLAVGEGSSNAILLIFMKDSGTLSVSIIPQPNGSIYVLLVK